MHWFASGVSFSAVLALLAASMGGVGTVWVARMRRSLDQSLAAVNDAMAAKIEADRAKVQAEIQDGIIADLRQHMQYLREEVDAKNALLVQSVTVTHKAMEVARIEQLHAIGEPGTSGESKP